MGARFNNRQLWLLVGLGLVSSLGYILLDLIGDARPRIYRFLFIYAGLFLAYAFAIYYLVLQKPGENGKWLGTGSNRLSSSTQILFVIITFAAIFRMMMLWDFPYLSDDIFRYIWDGRVWSSGVNPYQYPPADHALSHLRDENIYLQLNHKRIPTIYPPFLQVIFRSVYPLGSSLVLYKSVFLLFDLGTIFILILLLKKLAIPEEHILIYAWNPLVVVEIAGNGHIDGIGVFFLLLFFYWFIQGKVIKSSFALAAAVLTKFVPILLLPFAWLHWRGKKAFRFTFLVVLLILLAYAPFVSVGKDLFAGLSVYARKWHFNASLFQVFYMPIKHLLPDSWVIHQILAKNLMPTPQTLSSIRTDMALNMTKTFLALAFFIFYGSLIYRRARHKNWQAGQMPNIWLALFGTLSLISTTLYPWYLIWLIPILAITPIRAWLVLTGLIFVSYTILQNYYLTGIWHEQTLTRLIIFLPFYVLLVYELIARRAKQNSAIVVHTSEKRVL